MDNEGVLTNAIDRPSPLRRLVVWGLIVGVAWIPAVVALAMIVTGQVGP